jgi:two-component system OmpR family response regulator
VLVARLRALGRRGQTVPSELYAVGDLVLDVGTRECRRGETPIALTPRELALLAALLRRDGDSAPKEDLLHEVWGDGFAGDPNIVEVYVGYLRRKVDEPFGRASIATVRGIGYRLLDDRA